MVPRTTHRPWRTGLSLLLATAVNLLWTGSAGASADGTKVRLTTSAGVVEVLLFDDAAPLAVANFLNYVGGGRYANTLLQLIGPGLQAGAFRSNETPVTADAPITDELGVVTTIGAVAMYKPNNVPNSATSVFFFPLNDVPTYPAGIPPSNGTYTVFGRVVSGQTVINAISNSPNKVDKPEPIGKLPQYNNANVLITSISTEGKSSPVWTNWHTSRFDVNNDGHLFPRDMLTVINTILTAGERALTGQQQGLYYDVNSDGFVNKHDVASVYNRLLFAGFETIPGRDSQTPPNPQQGLAVVPEPAGWALAAVGLALWAAWSRQRRRRRLA